MFRVSEKMKSTMNKTVSVIMAAALLVLSVQNFLVSTVYAAEDDTVKIFIGKSDIARHHKAFEPGEVSQELSYEVNGYNVKSASYESSNTSAFQIIEEKDGKCKIKALKEGKGYVILRIRTTDEEMLTERLFISVYTSMNEKGAVINDLAGVYMGAITEGNVENYDKIRVLTIPK